MAALGISAVALRARKSGDAEHGRCGKIKQELETQKTALKATRAKFSLQEMALNELKKKLEAKVEEITQKATDEVKEATKDALLGKDEERGMRKVVEKAEKLKESYDDIKEKYEEAQKLYEALKKLLETEENELRALEIAYQACIAGSTAANAVPGDKIDLDVPGSKQKIFLATQNTGKIERFTKLINQTELEYEIFTPTDFHLENIDPVEDADTLAGNAAIKARAYFGKVDIPILANDTGFWVDGEGLIDAPKRAALGGNDAKDLSKEEIAKRLLEFWKGVARKHGGRVDAAWMEVFVRLDPDGKLYSVESRREVILTDVEHGTGHVQMPVRALYISKVTNKPSILHTEEEEMRELQPVTDALRKVLTERASN